MELPKEIGIYNDSSPAFRTLIIQLTGNDSGGQKLIADAISNFDDYDSLELSIVFFSEIIRNHVLVILATAIAYYVRNSKRVIIQIDTSTNGGKYLKELNFLDYWVTESIRYLKGQSDFKSIFNLWRIEDTRESRYTFHLETYFANLEITQNKSLSSILNAINEALLNVSQHSKSRGLAYVMTGICEKGEYLECAVYDCGFGIPHTLRNNITYLGASNYEALMLSLKPRVSSYSTTNNKGMGLYVILKSISEVEGNLQLSSENVTVEYDSTTKILRGRDSDFFIKGTLLKFEIPLSKLHDKSTLEEFFGTLG